MQYTPLDSHVQAPGHPWCPDQAVLIFPLYVVPTAMVAPPQAP